VADRLEELEETVKELEKRIDNLGKEIAHAYKIMLKAADRFDELKSCIEVQLTVNDGILIQLAGITKALQDKGIIVERDPGTVN
jgi:uncharacterized coiled-coil protein SlyX